MVQTNPPLQGTWVQIQPRTPRGKPRRVEFRFYPEYVRAIWARGKQKASLTTRGGVFLSPDSETLLLDASFPVENVTVFVRAWFIPARMPDTYHLRVEIAAPEGIKRAIRVILHWDNTEYTARLRKGVSYFEDISTPDFSRARNNLPSRRLRLTFEIENSDQDGSQ